MQRDARVRDRGLHAGDRGGNGDRQSNRRGSGPADAGSGELGLAPGQRRQPTHLRHPHHGPALLLGQRRRGARRRRHEHRATHAGRGRRRGHRLDVGRRGFRFTCGLRATGRLYCWGEDSNGKLGNGGPDTDIGVPTLVSGGAANWSSVTVGDFHACGRRVTGRLYCWGSDLDGQLGDGGIPLDRNVPTLVAGGATNWTAVTAGSSHTCARRATGRLYCWGYDIVGQLGNGGANTSQPTPVLVAGGVTNWSSVTAGDFSTCGRRANNRVYCWGADDSGQLGDGVGNTNQPSPVQVAGGGGTWASVESGAAHSCGRRITGRLYCWGNNFSGQVGNGVVGVNQPTALQLAGGATDWHSVSAGGTHSCARTTTGRLFCWGADNDGQLGDDGTNTDQPTPVEVFAP